VAAPISAELWELRGLLVITGCCLWVFNPGNKEWWGWSNIFTPSPWHCPHSHPIPTRYPCPHPIPTLFVPIPIVMLMKIIAAYACYYSWLPMYCKLITFYNTPSISVHKHKLSTFRNMPWDVLVLNSEMYYFHMYFYSYYYRQKL